MPPSNITLVLHVAQEDAGIGLTGNGQSALLLQIKEIFASAFLDKGLYCDAVLYVFRAFLGHVISSAVLKGGSRGTAVAGKSLNCQVKESTSARCQKHSLLRAFTCTLR